MLIKHVKDLDVEDEYITVKKNDTIFDIAAKMGESKACNIEGHDHDDVIYHPVLAAYIVEKGKPIGIINKDCIIKEVLLKGQDPKKVLAKDIMKPPICCSINQEVRDVVNLIIDKGYLTVPVCDGDQLVSVISVFDAIFLQEGLDEI